MSTCSWGRCRMERASDDRFCQKHSDQVARTQAGRVRNRALHREKNRQRWIERAMPGYEAALAQWQVIREVLLQARLANYNFDAIEQALVNLDAYKPKKPE